MQLHIGGKLSGTQEQLAKPNLHRLAVKYSVDKLYAHSYIPFYEDLFRHRTVKKVLEIGIGYEDLMTPFVPYYVHGASVKMWEEFWPEAEIYACDIRPEILINAGRIHSCVCDQSSVLALLDLVSWSGGDFDVVIDDGSHQTQHQILTAQTLAPFLAAGGVYIIEDVQEPDKVAAAVKGKAWKFPKRSDDNLVVMANWS